MRSVKNLPSKIRVYNRKFLKVFRTLHWEKDFSHLNGSVVISKFGNLLTLEKYYRFSSLVRFKDGYEDTTENIFLINPEYNSLFFDQADLEKIYGKPDYEIKWV